MYRSAREQDVSALCELWCQSFGMSAENAQRILTEVAELENVYLAEEEGQIVSVLAAIPVTMQQLPGVYFYGAVTKEEWRHKGKMAGLLEYTKQQQTLKGKRYGVVIPRSQQAALFWKKQKFVPYVRLRRVDRSIRRNLWAQANFDSITAARLGQLREKYAPNAVFLPKNGLVAEILAMYSHGATTVETDKGYGIFFEKGDILEFTELFAQSDYEAQLLLEAARERTGLEKAQILLAENGEICLGEGQIEEYALACFWAVQSPSSDGYMRLMLD